MTWQDFLKDALLETAVQDPIEPIEPNNLTLAKNRFNGIVDLWNADRQATYNVTFPTFTLTPNLNPHTIGPSGATFTVTQRPMEVVGANILLNAGTTSEVRIPLAIADEQWWLMQPVPNITATIPTALYYSPDVPNGSIYLWPVPSVAYGLELEVRFVLTQITDSDLPNTISNLPPGYQRALMLTLAEDVVTPLSIPMPPELPGKASKARAIVFGNNSDPVRVQTRQSGMMPTPRGGGSGYNWITGQGGGR